jgi:Flp pilus assembly protein CpaB
MRASTLFGVTIASLLGLGAAVGAKYTGVFDRQPIAEKKDAVVQILVAKNNLFEGMTATAADVRVRPLTEDEVDFYKRNKDKFMPPLPEAAQLRVMARSVGVNEPLLKEHFQDQSVPEGVSQRLDPGMRAVNLVLPKERASGGVLRVGELVDVLLTTNICTDAECTSPHTATATIARNLKIIVKRDTLWTVMAPIPDNLALTLQANPYRAALIEYAKFKGLLTLVPSASAGLPKSASKGFSDPETKEYRDEDARVKALLSGDLAVGEPDLERIFNLRPMAARVPPTMIERYNGVSITGMSVINGGKGAPTKGVAPAFEPPGGSTGLVSPSLGYAFQSPEGATSANAKAGCQTCAKKATN